ncbi:hypothetical protein HJC23_002265 [Cyclotella cryptica]|uniref:Leucine-rich repeat-containing protein DDB_G0290503 n=1 Tax=Cyclotella cryptica TaxID=29204 RepID=A0ABD3QFQ2_9STRA|eukprot:CCRYP_005728-RA/>CCRYP_005728-RA protein AED:0.07 eAED:0.07 QI:0/-1/0/1/-1/1/1/0/2041
MSGQHRRHRSSATGKNIALDVATPRASNNTIGLNFQSKHSSHDAMERTEKEMQHRGGNRQFHLDTMEMQHYQYQEDPQTKRHHEQSRLQYHDRNYSSEERQTTSECSRGSRSSLTPQRDDTIISHWYTPPRHRGSYIDGSSVNQHDSRERDQFNHHLNDERYYSDKKVREGTKLESKMKRSLSSGVVDMSRISNVDHSYQKTKPPSSGYSKDDSHRLTQQPFEGDLDCNSKKSKSSKGLLSRASHKIKKRLVGSNIHNGSGSSDPKGKVFEGPSGVEVCSLSHSHVDQSADISRLSVDVSTTQYVREGRDPSPTQNTHQREWLYPLDAGPQKVRSTSRNAVVMHAERDDTSSGMIYDDEGNLIEYFPKVDFSESDNSTLTSNFTYPMRDVILGPTNEQSRLLDSQRTKGRAASSNNLIGSPRGVERSTATASTSSRTPSKTKGSLDSKPPSAVQQQYSSTMPDQQLSDQKMGRQFFGLSSNDKNEKIDNIDKLPENSLNSTMETTQEIIENEEHICTDDSSIQKDAYSNASLVRDMMARIDSAKISEDLLSKQNTELVQENSRLSTEVEALRQKLLSNDNASSNEKFSISQLEVKLSSLEAELRKKDEEIFRATQHNSSIAQELEKSNEMALQLTKDLESYKNECSSHRERVLQSERENAKMEQLVYNERKKVLSLEAENAMLLNLADEKIGSANNAEKAKHSKMNAYKEQCKKYRESVIQLENKLIIAESALEAMGKMASALEQEKVSISAALDECKSSAESLKTELSAKEAKLLSVQEELTALQSKCSNVEGETNDNERTISALESENYNLLRKLDAQSSALVAFQKEETKHKHLELELASLKKRNDEMQMNEVVLRKQLIDAQDAASNAKRLQKMIADSESFISSVQKDLTETRSKYHQQLIEIRSKHSSEIDNLSNELQKEKDAKRVAEKLRNELEDKVLELETEREQLEQQLTNQSKAHEDQSSKLMHQLDEMREMLSGRREEINCLKRELADKSTTHQCLVAELERNLSSLEQQKNQSTTAVSTVEKDLQACLNDKQNLQAVIEEKERALNDLRRDLSTRDKRANTDIDRLNKVIDGLKQDLASAISDRQVLLNFKNASQKQIHTTKMHILDAIASLKKERAALASDIQTQLTEAKSLMINNLKAMVLEYCRKVENQQLNQSMNHQVALASLRNEASELETILREENNKAQCLQKSITSLNAEKENLSTALKAACSKLSVPEKDLVDKIDDLLLEISDARSRLATVSIDLTTTKSELAKIGHEKLQLALDNDHLKKVLSQTKAQIIEMEADSNDQNEKAQGVIACLEKTLAIKEQEWVESRTTLDAEMINLRREMDTEIATREKLLDELRAENKGIQTDAEKLKQEHDDIKSLLEETQSELSMSKKNLVSLNDQLRDKTETIHNLNDLLARASREAAEELANHYMKIEDELRTQLHSVQCEKESIQKQMKIQNEESERTIEEFFTAKRELSACVDQLSADLDVAQKKLVTMESEMQDLRKEKETLVVECNNLRREINIISNKDSSSSKQIKNLTSAIEKLNDVHVTSEREHTAELSRIADELIQSHSAEIDALNAKLMDANAKIDELKSTLDDINVEHNYDLKMTIEFYKAELDNQKTINAREVEDKDQEISNLRVEMDKIMSSTSLLQDSLKSVEETCSERENQIKQLKASLRDALQNALRADASKRESEDKLAEIAETLSNYEQIERCASTTDMTGSFHIKNTIERLVSEKQDLVLKLAESERHLSECQSSLNRLELKLTMAGQVNEKIQEESSAREVRLNRLDIENKEREDNQKVLEDRIKSMQAEWDKESETCKEMITRIQTELEKSIRNEKDLTEQIMVLKQDCEVETLYGELLDKMKGKEMQYESSIQKMTVENDALMADVASLTRENEDLLGALDEANAHATNLTQRLDEANALSCNLTHKLASVENELAALHRGESRNALNDEVSVTSTLASHRLNQTASELDTTIKEIKKHHETTVQNLQSELKEMRSKWKKSERRVQELSALLQENSKVIDALHRKLTSKKNHRN